MMKNSYNLQKTSFQALIALVGSYADPNESFRGCLLRFRCGIIRNASRYSLFFLLTACFIDLKRFTAQSSHRQSFGVEITNNVMRSALTSPIYRQLGPLMCHMTIRADHTSPHKRTTLVHISGPTCRKSEPISLCPYERT